ncbi:MAG: type IV toxin-antitoxin system AbiEi family antitoxin [Bacteroidota bacterium]
MTAANYIKQLLSFEEYSFSLVELQGETAKSKTSIRSELSRLTEKKEILNLRKGFYLIIPPRYSRQSQLPIQLYINKLFKNLNRKYYLGFYSAAKFQGASHQQIQRDYVITEKPKLKDIVKNGFDLRFFTTTKWPEKNILEKKSDAGIFKISSPALTVVDLIHHQTKLGGLSRMMAIIEELSEEINQNDIAELLTWYPHKSTLQRFGFLLEELQVDKSLCVKILKHLQQFRYFPVLLSPKPDKKAGAVNNPWKVDVNIELESDL